MRSGLDRCVHSDWRALLLLAAATLARWQGGGCATDPGANDPGEPDDADLHPVMRNELNGRDDGRRT